MKASELIGNLKKLIAEYGDLDLVYSKDDEGNCYRYVHFEPSPGIFYNDDDCFDSDLTGHDNSEVNAFCIN